MIKIKQIFLLLAWTLALAPAAFAQHNAGVSDRINQENDRAPSLEKLEKKAADARAEGDNFTALQYYARIIAADSLKVSALKNYAEIAVELGQLDSAAMVYTRLIDRKLTPDGTGIFGLATVKYLREDYAGARQLFQRYLIEASGASAEMLEAANAGLENCEWALTVKNTGKPFYMLDTTHINSRYSEFSPLFHHDTLYFSSYKFPFKKDNHYPQRRLIKVLGAEFDADSTRVSLLNINDEKRHTAHVAFNTKGDVMYYTLGDFVGDTKIHCELYKRERAANGTWGPAIKLPAAINLPEYTATEPSVGLSPDGKQEVLYFVSDRPEGLGKRDIWYARILPGGLYAEPVNLKTVNTAGDDVTPFYHSATSTLYFSTNGLKSLGGFDIYSIKGQESNWAGDPKHLDTPLNSPSNDVYYSLTDDGRTAFMASNRKGGQNFSEEACCYDLFRADLVKPQMDALAFVRSTHAPLNLTTMTLYEIMPDGSKRRDTTFLVQGNQQSFDIMPGKSYMIVAEKDHYSRDVAYFTTPKIVGKKITQELLLEPAKVNLVAVVFDRDSRLPIPGATARFEDLGPVLPVNVTSKGDTPVETKESTNASTNRFDYPLQFDRRYRVVVSKPGFTSDTTEIIRTDNIFKDTTLYDSLYIARGIDLNVLAFNLLTKDTLHGVTFRLVELEGGTRTDTYTNAQGNDYKTRLSFERRYMIVASKPGFSRDSFQISTKAGAITQKDFQTIVKQVFLRPLTLPSYLPIVLYFDNDEPDKRTLARATKREYRQAYVDYIRRKQTFIATYTVGLSGTELDQARAELDTFFERDVRGGWNKLMNFSEVLYEMMQQGDKIEITLKGYASPRAGTAYNLNLTERRVSSVYNHFDIFDGGIYKPFVESGQLVIIREPNGETKSPPGISDKINDERYSVYSVPASRERRLEIIGVRVNKEEKMSSDK